MAKAPLKLASVKAMQPASPITKLMPKAAARATGVQGKPKSAPTAKPKAPTSRY